MRKLKDLFHRYLFSRAARCRLPGGQRRIYFHHVMKTGGTSLNHMFFMAARAAVHARSAIELCGDPHWRLLLPRSEASDPDGILQDLWGAHRHRIAVGNLVFQTGDKARIEQGDYFYATSHFPQHALRLPPETFTFTVLRDPVERVLSYYRMLLSQRARGECIPRNEAILGASFDDFLDRVPRHKLLAQLHHYSVHYDIDEATESIAGCDSVLFLNELEAGLASLSRQIGLTLAPIWSNRSEVRPLVTRQQMDRLHETMASGILFYARMRQLHRPMPATRPAPAEGQFAFSAR